jgi:hypothetical protein
VAYYSGPHCRWDIHLEASGVQGTYPALKVGTITVATRGKGPATKHLNGLDGHPPDGRRGGEDSSNGPRVPAVAALELSRRITFPHIFWIDPSMPPPCTVTQPYCRGP